MNGVHLQTAANGFARLSTFSWWKRLWLGLLLRYKYGFRRSGRMVAPGSDDAIYPDFVRDNQRILSGWDNWFGFDLLADDVQTDAFLREFHAKHCL